MEIIENKALSLNVRNPGQITTVIPKSRIIKHLPEGGAQVLVSWGLDEAQALRNIGVKNVPSPIKGRYNWPGIYKPFDHQRITAEFLTLHRRAHCFNQMGTGKSAAAAWAADYLMTEGKIKRVLIVCPLSIMDAAWQADLFKVCMHRRTDIAHGSAEKRRKVIASEAEFVIINYDGVKVVQNELINGGFDLIICDEASALKNTQTDRWKSIHALLKPDTWLWLMTGTPAAQSPLDAYGLAKLVAPSRVPRFYGAWRDRVMTKINQFKWVPKLNAGEIVHDALQPAIRFTAEECLDLPELTYTHRTVPLTKQQQRYYDQMKKRFIIEAAGEEVTSVNAAVKINKLLQISCIAKDTPVLCRRGWVPIQDVAIDDEVWDGEEWVYHDGLIYRGEREVINIDGVHMTPEHEVLTDYGWKKANDILVSSSAGTGLNRTEVRLPNGYSARGRERREVEKSKMGMPLRLRKSSGKRESVSSRETQKNAEKLRLLSRQPDAQHVEKSTIQHLARYVGSVSPESRQGLQELWSTWGRSVSAVERFFRELLGGYVSWLRGPFDNRPHRRQWSLLTAELPLGVSKGSRQQQERYHLYNNSGRSNVIGGSCRAFFNKTGDAVGSDISVPVVSGAGVPDASRPRRTEKVYDILNCGPRSRFVVQGDRSLIVHNCGSAYTDSGEALEFDCSNRYAAVKETIDESEHKVLIFVPYRHAIQLVSQKLEADGITSDIIDGSVPVGKRGEIFKRFQEQSDPRVLVIQPQAAAHGVTLTAASTVIWWGPTSSLEIFAQANARVHRSGQRHPCTVVQLSGSPVEKHVYAMLNGKIDIHEKMIDLYKKVLE